MAVSRLSGEDEDEATEDDGSGKGLELVFAPAFEASVRVEAISGY